ncbi:cysteine protease StiP domain-containing protein [Halomonas sp. 11-S5]|uniref:cysteine protease StiP domain-containing protein n=1 Tax=Halomonas sp. 11-S5 TaxID=2994064 RepID=UPI0024697E97|nr:cysteine protease StiP domain-containing protein [Halomonas sp. 11-S5]
MLDVSKTIRYSYDPEDVTFLLTPIKIAPTDVAEKERLIQSGQAHYSEMISEERRPDARYMQIYENALGRHLVRIAFDIARIALRIRNEIACGDLAQQISLCSLVRAGVPYGVLLRRALVKLDVDVTHYGVSIIRDRGLDPVAMEYVCGARPNADILFVDGWTGKGAIAGELTKAWKSMSGQPPRLVVLADPSGHAWLAGSHEDWLIPSGILGANVSGLISRSILRSDILGPGDFHGAMTVDHLADLDRSRDFIERVMATFDAVLERASPVERTTECCVHLRAQAAKCVGAIAYHHEVDNLNRIKPGIAEATRAVLRRRPRKVFLRDAEDPDLAALLHLCQQDGVETEVDAEVTGPYRAITLIEKIS